MGQIPELMGFIDIHSHLLPGLDDGPGTLAKTLEAARCYVAGGFKLVIATPHSIPGTRWAADRTQVLTTLAETRQHLREAGIPLQILPGMEIAANEFLSGKTDADHCMPLADTGYYLIEFPMDISPGLSSKTDLDSLVAKTSARHCVIAHPERCRLFQQNIPLLHKLVENGMLVQVNISSILGSHGKKVQQSVIELFRKGLVHFLASDAHARPDRMPPGKADIATLEHILGTDIVQLGFQGNPGRLLAGEMILPLRTEPDGRNDFAPRNFLARMKCFFREIH